MVRGFIPWRPEFAAANPTLPRWFLDDRTDLSLRLAELRMPVLLLLWGDADPISPVRVGQRLAQRLPTRSCMFSLAPITAWALPMQMQSRA